jgi:hypothetical protein
VEREDLIDKSFPHFHRVIAEQMKKIGLAVRENRWGN